jgi:uncharacterized protein with GYD domain
MATFFMFGKYTARAVEGASPERTQQARRLIEDLGGRVRDIYALMGEHDLAIIVELPRMTDAMRASLALKKLTDMTFYTVAAMPIGEFDDLLGGT